MTRTVRAQAGANYFRDNCQECRHSERIWTEA